MASAFSLILNMSVTASIIILCVLLIRVCIKKLPKIFSYVLWSVVLFRLLCPVSISLPVSLLAPFSSSSSQTAASSVVSTMEYVRIEPQIPEEKRSSAQGMVSPEEKESKLPGAAVPMTKEEIAEFQKTSDTVNAAALSSEGTAAQKIKKAPGEWALLICCWLWLAGTAALLGVTIVQNIRLKKTLAFAYRLRDNIYECEGISTAFVLGAIKPRIYLPTGLPDDVRSAVIMHEQTHLSRGDNIFKLLAFLALALHWFNPLVWLAYKLACDDMEMSCDETVICKLNDEDHPMRSVKLGYGSMLVAVATGHWNMFAPVAFADSDTKSRVKNVAQYKRLTLRAVVAMVLICALFLGISVINPVSASVRDADGTRLITIGDQTFRSDVEVLDLSGLYLRDDDIADLKYCKNLKTLNIRENELTDLSVLKNCTELMSLDVSCNYLIDLSFLKKLKSLKQLNVENWGVENWGNGSIDISPVTSCQELEELNLNSIPLDVKTAKIISKLKKLHSLSAWGTDIEAIEELAQIDTLEEFGPGGFTYYEIRKAADEAIPLSDEMTELESHQQEDGYKKLYEYMPQLKSLSCGAGSSAECRTLALFTELTSLDIHYSERKPADYDEEYASFIKVAQNDDSKNVFEPLVNLRNLENLSIDIYIPDEVDKGISYWDPSFIRELPSLRSLSYSLRFPSVTNEGTDEAVIPYTGLFSEEGAVWKSTDLRELNISLFYRPWILTDEDVYPYIELPEIYSFPALEKLTVETSFICPVDLKKLSSPQSLKHLSFYDVNIQNLEDIGYFANLETFSMDYCWGFNDKQFAIGNEFASAVSLKNLRELTIHGSFPQDDSISSTSELPKLDLSFVKGLHSLEKLDIALKGGISNLGSLQYAEKLSDLTLELSYPRELLPVECSIIPKEISSDLYFLENMKSLRNLSIKIGNCQYSLEDISFVSNLQSLESLSVTGDFTSIPSLENLSNLRTAGFTSQYLSDIGGLSSCESLTELSLSVDGQLSDHSALKAIAPHLKHLSYDDANYYYESPDISFLYDIVPYLDYLNINAELSEEQVAEMKRINPDCKLECSGGILY